MTPTANSALLPVSSPTPPRAGAWLSPTLAWAWGAVAVATFHIAYSSPWGGGSIVFHLAALCALTRLPTARQASYAGLAVGLLMYGPQLRFFVTIFGPAAFALWFVLAFWVRLFLVTGRELQRRWQPWVVAVVLPGLWLGLEYFRSELYYLRFSWLTPGGVFANHPGGLPYHVFGTYGVGALLMAVVAGLSCWPTAPARWVGLCLLALALGGGGHLAGPRPPGGALSGPLVIAGVQLEFPTEGQTLRCLDQLAAAHPEAGLFVLSEYTFPGPLPESMRDWCRRHAKHLVVGAEELLPGGQYYNTVYVIGPSGQVVFQQAKCVPIQFFQDGLPAPRQALWDSPWGRLGFCICYDLSYSRVTDELVRLGAQGLIVPTMDVADWGAHQHELHARVAPVRAAEYGLPIFRLASSGVSQVVTAAGEVTASAPFPGLGAVMVAPFPLAAAGSRPLDRWLGPAAAWATGILLLHLAVTSRRAARGQARNAPASPSAQLPPASAPSA